MTNAGLLPRSYKTLAIKSQKGYNNPDGADQVRCVGGVFTCAGVIGLPPYHTAVIL